MPEVSPTRNEVYLCTGVDIGKDNRYVYGSEHPYLCCLVSGSGLLGSTLRWSPVQCTTWLLLGVARDPPKLITMCGTVGQMEIQSWNLNIHLLW